MFSPSDNRMIAAFPKYPILIASRFARAVSAARTARQIQSLDRRRGRRAILGRLLRDERIVVEGNDADPDVVRLLLDERLGRSFRSFDSSRLEIISAHTVRHIEGEDHRALAVGNLDASLRLGDADEQKGQSQHGEYHRHMSTTPQPQPLRARGETLGRQNRRNGRVDDDRGERIPAPAAEREAMPRGQSGGGTSSSTLPGSAFDDAD